MLSTKRALEETIAGNMLMDTGTEFLLGARHGRLIVARLALAVGNERDKAVKEARFARLAMTGSEAAATGFEANTIHRRLEVDPKSGGFRRGEDNASRDPRRRRAR